MVFKVFNESHLTAFFRYNDHGMGIVSLHSNKYPGFRMRVQGGTIQGKVCTLMSCIHVRVCAPNCYMFKWTFDLAIHTYICFTYIYTCRLGTETEDLETPRALASRAVTRVLLRT